MSFTPLQIIIAIVIILAIVIVGLFWNLRSWKRIRKEQYKFLQELEVEALASEQTGPVYVNSKKPDVPDISQNVPEGLILHTLENAEAAIGSDSGLSGLSVTPLFELVPITDYIDIGLSWVRSYEDPRTGIRFDLRPSSGGPLAGIIEWHYYGMLKDNRTVAQIGDQIYTISGGWLRGTAIRKAGEQETVAVLLQNTPAVKFTGGQIYKWVITNPVERPSAFISRNGMEILTYTGPMANIRVKSTNPEIVSPLILLLMYEHWMENGKR